MPAPASRLATGANLRSADQEVLHDAERTRPSIALQVVQLLQDGPLGGTAGMGSPDPLG